MVKIITPVVSVFDKDLKIDYAGTAQVIKFLLQNQVDGILVLGSTGEFPNLDLAAKKEYFQFYRQHVPADRTLYAGVGCMNYEDTRTLAQAVLQMGYTAVVVIEPYYFRMSQTEIFHFYDRLATEVQGSLLIYNYPQLSGSNIAATTISRLIAQHSNIVGLKDTIDIIEHTNQVFQQTQTSNFTVYSGMDDQFLFNAACGGAGCIGALSNIVPDIWSTLVQSYNEQNFEQTMRLSRLIASLMPLYTLSSNPAVLLKHLLNYRGVAIPTTGVFPFAELKPETLATAKSLLQKALDRFYKD